MILIAALFGSALSLPTTTIAQQNCPPGLAKKDPACIPPGLARQGQGQRTGTAAEPAERLMTADEWRALYAPGDYLEDDRWTPLENYNRSLFDAFPRLSDDRTYAVVDGGVVVLSRTSSRILRLIDILGN